MFPRTLLCLGLGLALVAGAACRTTEVRDASGEKLTLVAPANQTVKRGETNPVTVLIHRTDGGAGEIPLRFADLPKGVEIVERDPVIPAGQESARVTLYAKPDADLVSGHAVRVTAKMPQGPSVTETFHVTVKAN